MMNIRKARSLKMKQSQVPWQILLAGVLSTTVACAAEGAESIQILRNQLPAEGCEIPLDTSGAFQPRGRIDVAAGSGYLFTPLVQSNVEPSMGAGRWVFVEGADISLEFVGANAPSGSFGDLLNFRSLFSGSIEPGGVGTFAFDVVPKQLLGMLTVNVDDPLQVVASVELVGTLDGGDVRSNTFNYPIEICNGCMTNVLGACLGLTATEISSGGTCQTLQDGVLDCCTDEAGALVCPAVPIVPTLR
jgi:hypothetical protein